MYGERLSARNGREKNVRLFLIMVQWQMLFRKRCWPFRSGKFGLLGTVESPCLDLFDNSSIKCVHRSF